MFELNCMSRQDKTGAPVDLFLGRSVNSLLPNAGNKIISIKKDVEKRKLQQERWMRKLGKTSSTDFQPGDKVRIQNTKSGEWDLKGVVEEVICHDGGSNTYSVVGESGGTYLRNGRYIKLRVSKARKLHHVTFSPLCSTGG